MHDSRQTTGAVPLGVETPDERVRAAAVRDMFSLIAPRYDLLNHLLSCNVDRSWWRRAARTFTHILRRDGAAALDLCCGTGDMTAALLRVSGTAKAAILGADFSHNMLQLAHRKYQATRMAWVEADALHLPFAAESFDLVTSAFGFRNLANYDAGLREMHRVLRRNGEVGILDFGEPKGLMGKLYRVYFRRVLPAIGTMISGVRGPYAYLPASVARFPAPEQMLERMMAAGFTDVTWTPYTLGVAGLYRGKKL
jgi:demethylmenaquinone methyltransferase/2-methoxy-6-polyprenyl-1,4-benzoquinol methylase